MKPKLDNHSDPTTAPPTYNTPLPNVTQCTYKIIHCSLLTYFLTSSSTTVTYLPTESTSFTGIRDISSTNNYQNTILDNTSYTNETFVPSPIDSIITTQETSLFTKGGQKNYTISSSDTNHGTLNQTNETEYTVVYNETNYEAYNETKNVTSYENVNNETMITDDIEYLTTSNFDNKTDEYFEIEGSTIPSFENATEYELDEVATFSTNFTDEENRTLQYEFSTPESIQIIDMTTDNVHISDSGKNIYGSFEENELNSTEDMTTNDSSGELLNKESTPVVNNAGSLHEPLKNYDYALEFSNETQQDSTMEEIINVYANKKRSIKTLVKRNKQPQDDLEVFPEVDYAVNETFTNGNNLFKTNVHKSSLIDDTNEEIMPKEVTHNGAVNALLIEDDPLESMIKNEFPNLDIDLISDHLPTTFSDYFLDNFTGPSNDVIEGDNPSENLTPPPNIYKENDTNTDSPRENSIESNSNSVEKTSSTEVNNIGETNGDNKLNNQINLNEESPNVRIKLKTVGQSTTPSSAQSASPSAQSGSVENHLTNPSYRGESISTPSVPIISPIPSQPNKDTKERNIEKMCVIYECVPKFIEEELHKNDKFTTTLQTFIPKSKYQPTQLCILVLFLTFSTKVSVIVVIVYK